MENKKILTYFLVLTTGCILLAVSINVFLVPYKISAGGSDFAGLILKKFLPHISLARLIFIIDVL